MALAIGDDCESIKGRVTGSCLKTNVQSKF